MKELSNEELSIKEFSIREKMKIEALERLEMLQVSALVRAKILNDWQITKCVVDFENESIMDTELTKEEVQLVEDFEREYDVAVYYVIEDQGIWPDGYTFSRYSFLYVSGNENEWEMEKEECIKRCKTIPAYVINCDEPDCSEITEIGYRAVKGSIINIT